MIPNNISDNNIKKSKKSLFCENCFFFATNACTNPKQVIILDNCCNHKKEEVPKKKNIIIAIWNKIKSVLKCTKDK